MRPRKGCAAHARVDRWIRRCSPVVPVENAYFSPLDISPPGTLRKLESSNLRNRPIRPWLGKWTYKVRKGVGNGKVLEMRTQMAVLSSARRSTRLSSVKIFCHFRRRPGNTFDSTCTTLGLPRPQYAQQTLGDGESCKIQETLYVSERNNGKARFRRALVEVCEPQS